MNNQVPPPIPDPNSAVRTYVRAVALLIPTFYFWFFAHVFLLPKLQQVWQLAGLANGKVQWLMDGSLLFMSHGRFLFAGVILLLVLLELRWSTWPRYRRTVVACATLFFHTAILVDLTAICTATLLAAPLLTKAKLVPKEQSELCPSGTTRK